MQNSPEHNKGVFQKKIFASVLEMFQFVTKKKKQFHIITTYCFNRCNVHLFFLSSNLSKITIFKINTLLSDVEKTKKKKINRFCSSSFFMGLLNLSRYFVVLMMMLFKIPLLFIYIWELWEQNNNLKKKTSWCDCKTKHSHIFKSHLKLAKWEILFSDNSSVLMS